MPTLWAFHDHSCSTHHLCSPGCAHSHWNFKFLILANQNHFWHTSDPLSFSRNHPACVKNNQKAPITHLFDYLTCPSESLPCRIMTFQRGKCCSQRQGVLLGLISSKPNNANELPFLPKHLFVCRWHPDTPNKRLCVPVGGSRPRLRSHPHLLLPCCQTQGPLLKTGLGWYNLPGSAPFLLSDSATVRSRGVGKNLLLSCWLSQEI